MDYQQIINNFQNLSGAHVWLFLAVSVFIIFAILTLMTFRQFNRHPENFEDEIPEQEEAEVALIDTHKITEFDQYKITKRPLMIGRLKATNQMYDSLIVPESTVGRRHAVIKFEKGSYWLQDQGSVNGSYVNGQRIENSHRLRDGDHIRFHKFSFQFVEQITEDLDRTKLDITLPKMPALFDQEPSLSPNDVLVNHAQKSGNVIEISKSKKEVEERVDYKEHGTQFLNQNDSQAELAIFRSPDLAQSDQEIRKNIQDMTIQLFKSPDDDKTMRLYAKDLDGPPELRPDYDAIEKEKNAFPKEPLLPNMDVNVMKALGDFFSDSKDEDTSDHSKLELTSKGDKLARMGQFPSTSVSRDNEEKNKG